MASVTTPKQNTTRAFPAALRLPLPKLERRDKAQNAPETLTRAEAAQRIRRRNSLLLLIIMVGLTLNTVTIALLLYQNTLADAQLQTTLTAIALTIKAAAIAMVVAGIRWYFVGRKRLTRFLEQ